jgi:hypothetical protein
MALIRGAYGGGQIKGSVSGNTFQGNPYGTVLRNRTVPVNPNTPAQSLIRLIMSTLSAFWRDGLSPAQRTAWELYAQGTPLPDKFGTNQIVPGRQHFLRANIARYAAGANAANDPPPTPGIGSPPALSVTISVADGIELQSIGPSLEPDDLLRISISIPVNETVNFYKSPFGRAINVINTDTLPLTILADVIAGQKFFMSYRFYAADGRVSNEIMTPIGVAA